MPTHLVRPPARRVLPALLLFAWACSDTTQPQPRSIPPASVAAVAGDGQTGVPRRALPGALTVLVADSAGHPLPGVSVVWTVDAEAGHADVDSLRTGADGRASVRWTLGDYIGEWTATAHVSGLAPVVFHASAGGPIHVRILHPAAGDTVDTVLAIELLATAEGTVTDVGLTVEGRVVPLLTYAGTWYGSQRFDGVPAGPQRLRATARDNHGNLAMAIVEVVHDSPLQIRILDPVGGVLAGRVPVRAVCVDDNQNSCRSFEAFSHIDGVDTRIAQGADSISTTFLVADLAADSVAFVFHATDVRGKTTTVETRPFGVVRGPWTQIVAVPGTLLDASPDWAVYVDGESLQMVNVRTGVDQHLFTGSSIRSGPEAAVTPVGAVVNLVYPCCGNQNGLVEWGGSNATSHLGSSPRGAGRWAAWFGPFPDRVNRDDVLARSLAYTPEWLSVTAFDLADDGTIAIAADQLYVWRGATITQLTAYADSIVLFPVTDGSSFVYFRTSRDNVPVLTYRGADGHEEALTGPLPALASTGANAYRHQMLNGWAAFDYPDASGAFHTFVRTPSGEVHAVWPGAPGGARLLSVGPQGQVVLSANGVLYLSQAPHGTATPLGSWGTVRRAKWIDGKLFLVKGSGLFRYDGP